ncbi:MAG: hypothetical protein ACXWAV_01235, partial [Chthoniobacterales bacterium]
MRNAPKERNIKFPYVFEQNGRMGKIYRLGNGTFKTYFRFAGGPKTNTHATFSAAFGYLSHEFETLDSNRANALSLNPLNGDVRSYSELESMLREQVAGATLRDAVNFYLAHHRTKKLKPRLVEDCAATFVAHQEANG